MLSAERKSLLQFVSLFVALNTVFLLVLSVMYYYYQKNVYLDVRRNSMIYYAGKAYEHIYAIKSLGQIDGKMIRDPRFDVAFLSPTKKIVYASVPDFKVPFRKDFFDYEGNYFYVESIELESLGAIRYIVVRARNIDLELAETRHAITLFVLFSIVFMSAVVYALSKLFLRPLREYIGKLDRFIRDTTHELNTPLSVISMSLERIDRDAIDPKTRKALDRMTVAVRTISHLYHDLTFLMLYQKDGAVTRLIDMEALVRERIDYFRPLADGKQIVFDVTLLASFLTADSGKIIRIVDNLLSNAIKYNKRGGTIRVRLEDGMLEVADTGIGIAPDKIGEIFTRYSRFDDANGGFGIGLNIVRMICDEYGLKIDVASQPEVGTAFVIRWDHVAHDGDNVHARFT